MMLPGCPGQDRRHWGPDDVFEIPCPGCGYSVEFFKIDISRRCPACGRQMLNPRFDLGCAQWCAYAEQCLGELATTYQRQPETVRYRLERELRRRGVKHHLVRQGVEVVRAVQEILPSETGANAVVVIAAGLLFPWAASAGGEMEASREVMEAVGLPRQVVEQVLEILGQLLSGRQNGPSLRVLRRALGISGGSGG